MVSVSIILGDSVKSNIAITNNIKTRFVPIMNRSASRSWLYIQKKLAVTANNKVTGAYLEEQLRLKKRLNEMMKQELSPDN